MLNELTSQKEVQPEIQNQEFVMRDDIINFSAELALSARNKYRRKSYNHKNILNLESVIKDENPLDQYNEEKPKVVTNTRYSNGTNLTQQQSVQIIVNQRKSAETVRIRSRGKNMNFSGSSEAVRLKPDIDKREIFTMRGRRASFQKNKQLNWQAFNFKNQVNGVIDENLKEDEAKNNSYDQTEKKYNKKAINSSGVAQWLNQALIQATPGISVNKNQIQAAIKFYGIDRSSLLSKGIHPDGINRVYKSLFVYSIGFNSLLKQMCPNMNLRKSIWKVFAILLQYCSGGNFETMIGQIQRDKMQKLTELRSEIEKRQKIIEDNEEINEKKNAKIYKEFKELQESNKNLKQQKQVILRDFHEAEQAFNQEILLRLKYQNRINEIHGVYEEIRTKNQGLREAHTKQVQTINSQKNKIQELTKEITTLNSHIEHENNQRRLLESMNKLLTDQVTNLQKNLRTTGMNYYSAKSDFQNSSTIITELERKIEQMQKKLFISRNSEESTTKSLKVSNEEYERSLRENIELIETSKIQMSKISQLMEKIRKFGSDTSELQAEIRLKQLRLQEQFIINKSQKEEVSSMKQLVQKKQLQLQTEIQIRKGFELDLQECLKNIQKMKEKQENLQIDYEKSLNENIKLNEVIVSKQDQLKTLKTTVEDLTTKIFVLNKTIQTKQTSIKILEDKLESEISMNKEKVGSLTKQYETLKAKYDKFEQEKNQLIDDVDRNRLLYEEMYGKLKNQKFQRNNLELRYNQSLTVMEDENEHIKKLNIRISELNQKIDELKRKIVNDEFIFKEEKNGLVKEASFWKKNYDERAEEIRIFKTYVHPSKYWDLFGHLMRIQQKYNKIQLQYTKLENKVPKNDSITTKKQKDSLQELEQHHKQKEQFYKNILEKKQNELKFQKEKTAYHHQKIQQMEKDMEKIRKQTNLMVEQYRNRDTQNEEKVKERNMTIKKLNKRIEELVLERKNFLEEREKQRLNYEEKLEIFKKKRSQNKIQSEIIDNEAKEPAQEIGGLRESHRRIDRKMLEKISNHKKDQNQQEESIEPFQSKYPQNTPVKIKKTTTFIQKTESNKINDTQFEQMNSQELDMGEDSRKKVNIRKKLKGAYMYYHK